MATEPNENSGSENGSNVKRLYKHSNKKSRGSGLTNDNNNQMSSEGSGNR